MRYQTFAWAIVALLCGCAHRGAGTGVGTGVGTEVTSVPTPVPTPVPVADSVNVGYGSRPRGAVTEAIGAVDLTTTNERPAVSHVLELLEGRIAGLSIRRGGDGYTVRLRGGSSSANGGEPLFVVDGIPIAADESAYRALEWIDPHDVARVEVLKDAGSSIYGMRGVNGVVLITLRR